MVNIPWRESWNADALLYWKRKGSMGHNHAEETTFAILFNPHAIVEDSIATVEKLREPTLYLDVSWM